MKCPNDFLKISGIDESNTGNGTFPQDTGFEYNSVKICGKLAEAFTYTHVPGRTLQLMFNVNSDAYTGEGFSTKICVA